MILSLSMTEIELNAGTEND